jgi:2-keto-4-pentenoate hydratase/2-oxohepta-3-ene-1,7-dioic acid hydratase in catechol pathway
VARNPPLYMKHGDICEIEIEGIGILRNTSKINEQRSQRGALRESRS